MKISSKSSADSESTSEHARSKKKSKKGYRGSRNNKYRIFNFNVVRTFELLTLSLCRISPEESRDDDATTKQRRGKSAPHAPSEISRHTTDKVAPDGGVQSPPDPLEPWSTRDIKSINNILDTSDRE